MKPVTLEIVTRTLTTYGHCRHCGILFDEAGLQKEFEQGTLTDYPQELQEESSRLCEWIRELNHLYKHRLLIRLIDVHSPIGMLKCLRHWIRKYPAFIVNGKETLTGWDRAKLENLIDKHIRMGLESQKRTPRLNTCLQ